MNLNISMGVDPRTPTQVVDLGAPVVPKVVLNDLVPKALANRPDMVQAQQNILAAEDTLKGARSSNLPSVVASAGVGLGGNGFPGSSFSKSVGVSLSWDLYDSGFTAGQIKQAQASLNASKIQLYQVQQTVVSDLTQAYLNLTNAQQKVATSDAEVANAQESLRLAEGQYQEGVGIFLGVTDAQTALSTAQANQVNAVYNLHTAIAALDHALGQ
jgi:outer membrane protein TolC